MSDSNSGLRGLLLNGDTAVFQKALLAVELKETRLTLPGVLA